MIIDDVKYLSRYAGIAPEVWSKVVDFVEAALEKTPELGKHEIVGSDAFAICQTYTAHPADMEKLEYHKKYIDIQLLLAGNEEIWVENIDNLEETVPYSEEKDCGFYKADDKTVKVALNVGNFAIFPAMEGHMPGIGNSDVVKVVVKIAVK
jgi:YhcH/YjgK/YiaL family protein